MKRRRVAFFSVVPSPYQRDLFAALALRPEIELHVFYSEHASPDSPWPERALAEYERVLPGFWFSAAGARWHVNWSLPRLRDFDLVVVNTVVLSFTAQRLMRCDLRGRRWAFWGERLRRRDGLHRAATAPLHRATGIIAVGSHAQREYRDRFPEPQHFNIPYHCDLKRFLETPRPELRGSEITFLFCGQMIARKGLDLLLEAFTRLDSLARLLLIGREAELPQMLAALPVEVRERVHYAGFQAPEDLPRFFAQADVFVLPSRYDGWGVVVNQALGAGLPILCSDAVGASYDLVTVEANGLIFPSDNPEALAAAMQRLVDHPKLIEDWGRASRGRASAWQPEGGAAKWVEAIQALVPA